jgi:hypothetical protein
MSDESTTDQAQVLSIPSPRHQISFVIDGKVQDTIWVPDRIAAILMSDPLIVYSKGVRPITGQTTYDPETKTFTHPGPDGGVSEKAEEYNPES